MICRSCYRDVPAGAAFCPACGARVGGPGPGSPDTPPTVATTPTAPSTGAGPWSNPWEQRAGRGPVAAFAETLQESLFRPTAFFRSTAPDRGVGSALWYAIVVGTLSIAAAHLWQRALGQQLHFEQGGEYLHYFERWEQFARNASAVPVQAGALFVYLFVSAAVLHISLAVLGGARGTYGTTLKAVCYSLSAMAFNVFPVCGAVVGAVWQAVLQVIGMRELHRTTTGRAFWALFLPLLVASCVAGLAAAAMVLGLVKIWHEFGGGKFDV